MSIRFNPTSLRLRKHLCLHDTGYRDTIPSSGFVRRYSDCKQRYLESSLFRTRRKDLSYIRGTVRRTVPCQCVRTTRHGRSPDRRTPRSHYHVCHPTSPPTLSTPRVPISPVDRPYILVSALQNFTVTSTKGVRKLLLNNPMFVT